MFEVITEGFLYRANWVYGFFVEGTFHLQKDPWNLGYFLIDYWNGNY